MKKLIILSIFTIIGFISYSQTLKTNIMWYSFTDRHDDVDNTINVKYGKNKDVYWYHSKVFNEVFTRKSNFKKGKTTSNEKFVGALYDSVKDGEVFIQYFKRNQAVRISYIDMDLIIEFFKTE